MVRSGYRGFRQSKLGQLQRHGGQHLDRQNPGPGALGGLHASSKPKSNLNANVHANGYGNSNRNRHANSYSYVYAHAYTYADMQSSFG
jgi:hypothetical protein